MAYCVRIGVLLLAVMLVAPSPTWLHASSEGGHGSEAKKGEKKDAGKAVDGVINIGPLVVNVLSTKKYKFLRLGMQVHCADDEAAERLLEPDCREELILMLSSKVAEDLLTNAGKMVLRKELLTLFNKYAGEGKVRELYFTEFVFQ